MRAQPRMHEGAGVPRRALHQPRLLAELKVGPGLGPNCQR
jgi:hypothetical protein